MKTHISISTIREQISRKIKNYQTTIDGIGQGNPNTEWHHKQIKHLQERIAELEWVLNTLIPEPKPFCLVGSIDDGIEEAYLDNNDVYQKDKNGVYCYISDNEKHMTNLVALLESFREYMVALSYTNTKKHLPNNEECMKWYDENIDKDCSPSSAIYKFRLWIKERINPANN